MKECEYIAHACIKRKDGVFATGRSHSEIINSSPYGTCKNIPSENQGFMTSRNRFVGRTVAFEIAYEANQITEEMYENSCPRYLLSEYIWSDMRIPYDLVTGYLYNGDNNDRCN